MVVLYVCVCIVLVVMMYVYARTVFDGHTHAPWDHQHR